MKDPVKGYWLFKEKLPVSRQEETTRTEMSRRKAIEMTARLLTEVRMKWALCLASAGGSGVR
jgi:hypothetical protein